MCLWGACQCERAATADRRFKSLIILVTGLRVQANLWEVLLCFQHEVCATSHVIHYFSSHREVVGSRNDWCVWWPSQSAEWHSMCAVKPLTVWVTRNNSLVWAAQLRTLEFWMKFLSVASSCIVKDEVSAAQPDFKTMNGKGKTKTTPFKTLLILKT